MYCLSTPKKPISVTNFNVVDHAYTSSQRFNWCVNKTDLFETFLRCLTVTQKKPTNEKPILTRLFCLNFSSKAPWCSPVPLKFESYNLQHCKKNCCNLIFCVLLEQLLSNIMFGRLHYYEVTLIKKYNKPLLQKSETNVFKQKKKIIKNLLKVNEKKTSDLLRLN